MKPNRGSLNKASLISERIYEPIREGNRAVIMRESSLELWLARMKGAVSVAICGQVASSSGRPWMRSHGHGMSIRYLKQKEEMQMLYSCRLRREPNPGRMWISLQMIHIVMRVFRKARAKAMRQRRVYMNILRMCFLCGWRGILVLV